MYWSAFLLGFVGSTHCVVMCGPLLLSIPGQKSFSKFLTSRLIYHLGRILMYVGLGFLFGLISEFVYIGQLQQTFSVILGIVICLMAFAFFASAIESRLGRLALKLIQPLKNTLRNNQKHGPLSHMVGGFLNGILPCGLVYVALFASAASSSVLVSSQYMLLFGLGTIPATLAISVLGKALRYRFSRTVLKLSSVLIFCLGAILIVRGLGLDIPYLSPAMDYFHPIPSKPVICK